MDKDRVKGKEKELEGKTQQKWGESKGKARDTWDDAKEKAVESHGRGTGSWPGNIENLAARPDVLKPCWKHVDLDVGHLATVRKKDTGGV